MEAWTGSSVDRELGDTKFGFEDANNMQRVKARIVPVGSFTCLFSSHGSFDDWLGLGPSDRMRLRRLITLGIANKAWEVGLIDRGRLS